jgi:pimeloyl-ACP methyl ester carboxylesterase
MPKVHANGIDIYYEIQGQGRPLVLIAGISYTHWMWHKMAPELAQHYQVILFDNRGVGETDATAGPYSAQMMAEDTAGLLDALNIEKAAIMGHSMGGFIAQALVLDHPERVEKLILAATNFGGPNHIPVTPEAMAVLSDVSGDPLERFKRGLQVSTAPGFAEANPEIIAAWVAYRSDNPIDPSAYQAQLAVGLGLISEQASFEKKLKNVQAPTLILFGEHDKVVPVGNAELLHQQIPNSQIKILSNAGHFFPIEKPHAATEAIVEFLG